MERNRDFIRHFGNTVPRQLPAASVVQAFWQGEVETFLWLHAQPDPRDREITPSLSAHQVPHPLSDIKTAIDNIPVFHC